MKRTRSGRMKTSEVQDDEIKVKNDLARGVGGRVAGGRRARGRGAGDRAVEWRPVGEDDREVARLEIPVFGGDKFPQVQPPFESTPGLGVGSIVLDSLRKANRISLEASRCCLN